MADAREIWTASLGETVWQMPAAVIVVEASSGKVLFRNKLAQEIREQSLSWARGTKLEDTGGIEIIRPGGTDSRKYASTRLAHKHQAQS